VKCERKNTIRWYESCFCCYEVLQDGLLLEEVQTFKGCPGGPINHRADDVI